MSFARIKILEKTWLADQRQCKYGWVNDINTPTISPMHHTSYIYLAVIPVYIWSSTVRACSYRYYLMKNNTEWTISAPTTSPCEVRLFELEYIGTIVSVYEKQQDTGTGKLRKLCSGTKAFWRKWKPENETENPNTSYLAIH